MNLKSTLGVLVIFTLMTSIIATSIPLLLKQAVYGAVSGHPLMKAEARPAPTSAVDTTPDAPIATSGDNVYVA
jgi:hypothetical protein